MGAIGGISNSLRTPGSRRFYKIKQSDSGSGSSKTKKSLVKSRCGFRLGQDNLDQNQQLIVSYINLQLALSFSPLKKPFILIFNFYILDLDLVLVLKFWNPDSTLVPVLGKDLEPGSSSKPSCKNWTWFGFKFLQSGTEIRTNGSKTLPNWNWVLAQYCCIPVLGGS